MTRKAAARQLGEIQKLHPHELPNLLGRVCFYTVCFYVESLHLFQILQLSRIQFLSIPEDIKQNLSHLIEFSLLPLVKLYSLWNFILYTIYYRYLYICAARVGTLG